jgi:uncharacterized protein (DUF2147 family)
MRSAIFILFMATSFWASGQSTILGKWKSIDDETGKARSFVQVYQTSAGLIEGKILEVIPGPGDESDPICNECPKDDPRHGKKVNGMVIITKMKLADDKITAKGGRILDPESGSEYGCILSLANGGKELKVRGFLGFAVLGRTQIWQRAN